MKKRIIDSMTAKQIADGCVAIINRVELEEYLESICKPAPSWEDAVSGESPVPCYVGDCLSDLEEKAEVDMITGIEYAEDAEYRYISKSGCPWVLATPVPPNDCWKPTNNGGVK